MKNKKLSLFNTLKKVLINSGYQVVLTTKMAPRGHLHSSKFRETKGFIVPDQLKIYINRRISVNDRVVTLVHELLHEVYPTWQESTVERRCKQIFRDLTVSQLGFFQFFVMTRAEMAAAIKRLHTTSPIC
jgi:hypothetical protein